MTDYPQTAVSDAQHARDPPAVEKSFASLSPTVRAIAVDAVGPREHSVPVALCALASATATHHDSGIELSMTPLTDTSSSDRDQMPFLEDSEVEGLEHLIDAVSLLEGYVRIRAELLTGDRYNDADQRDAAVLASDFLHAAAYEPIADIPIPDHRATELYRILATGSGALAVQFMHAAPAKERAVTAANSNAGTTPQTPADESTDTETTPAATASGSLPPTAVLAGTAATLGATAVGASTEIRTTLETYAHSLTGALSVASTGETGEDPRETTVHVLAGETNVSHAVESEPCETTTTHLERAREACQTLEDRLEATTECDALHRLERATRIPFHANP